MAVASWQSAVGASKSVGAAAAPAADTDESRALSPPPLPERFGVALDRPLGVRPGRLMSDAQLVRTISTPVPSYSP